jgi:O-6-methylguanine DNA methyltransferase
MNKKSASRRRFIRDTSLAAAGFFIVPRHVLGRGYVAPSDKLHIAAIGVGGKGTVNIEMAHKSGVANIVALCDVDDRQAAPVRKQFDKAPYYRDFRQLLSKEEKRIDAVIISTPDHMHAVQALPFMQLGKHIYLEKPLTHDIYEARILTQAAEKYKVVTQMGNQGSSGTDTRNVEAWIEQGIIGDVHTVHVWTNRPVWPQGIATPTGKYAVPKEVDWDLWLGTAPWRDYHPAYLPATWRGWVDFGTGALGDMGCHFMDVPYRALKLGYPVAVECSVVRVWTGFFQEAVYTDSYPPSSKIHIQFPARGNKPAVELIWYDGGHELLNIPFGKTISYLELSRRLGDPKAIRAVAAANGKNQLAIIVPCHRVIGSNRELVGYAGGLWRKKWLLDHENKVANGVQTLF